MRESGEALVMTLGVTDGLEVLDLGCGDGTTASGREADLQAELEALFNAENTTRATMPPPVLQPSFA